MHFLLTTLNVVHVLSSTVPEEKEDETPAEIRKHCKWENDDYICRGHILNGMSDSLFDIYQNVVNAKQLWNDLESKYIAEDASSKKFLVSNFNNYKMVDSRPVMEQYNELLRILGQFTQHDIKMDECFAVSSVIDKLPPSWKDFKHTLKHQKEELSLVQLGSHFRKFCYLHVFDPYFSLFHTWHASPCVVKAKAKLYSSSILIMLDISIYIDGLSSMKKK